MPDGPGGFAADHPPRPPEPFFVAPTPETTANLIRAALIPVACWRLDDIRFEFDSSFVKPEIAAELSLLAGLMKQHPKGPLSVFGHADPVGKDDYNKALSGRRAIAIYALLTRRADLWEKLYGTQGDKWGQSAIYTMLGKLGYGKNTSGVVNFQKANELKPDGDPGPKTREKLFLAYMDATCKDPDGNSFKLEATDFLARGADPDGKGDYQGCSEFNPVLVFSKAENKELSKASKKAKRDAANSPNRRVVIFLFRPNSVISPGKWPCPRATEGFEGCKKRFWSDGETRRDFQDKHREQPETHDTFACRFYDRIAWRSPCETIAPVPLATTDYKIWNARWSPEKAACGDKVKLLADTDLPDAEEIEVTLKAKQGSSPNLVAPEGKSGGGRIEVEWEVHDVSFAKDAGFLDFVEVEATLQAAKAALATSTPLKVDAFLKFPEQPFDEKRSWSGFTNHSNFQQSCDKFRNQVKASFKMVKAWGAYWVNLSSAGITGKAGGNPWNGFRWARSTSANPQAPNEYYDGSAWLPFPAGFTLSGTNHNAMSFYKKDGKFVSLSGGGTWPEDFTDYNFDSATNKGKRDAWVKDTHDRWTDQFHIRRKECHSQQGNRCCVYEVEVSVEFTEVKGDKVDGETIAVAEGNLRSNAKNWFLGDSRVEVGAHETGHHLDNPDEYNDGAVDPSLNGDGAVNGIDPDCIMGQNLTNTKKRHYHAFADTVKKGVKAAYGRDYQYETINK